MQPATGGEADHNSVLSALRLRMLLRWNIEHDGIIERWALGIERTRRVSLYQLYFIALALVFQLYLVLLLLLETSMHFKAVLQAVLLFWS